MAEQWYKEAVVYSLDVETFQDGDGDGIGDFRGLISRLDYLDRLGATCLWLHPIHPSPNRDDGYDVTDYYAVAPHLGTLGDFADFLHEADNRGLRVILDLVVNHTSNEHPWFQAARSDPASPYRDWYVWSDEEPAHKDQGVVFPGSQETTWTYDEQAGAWYFHRFYDFQPDLNIANPAVREEIERIMGFWLRLGVSGFRMDAAPFVISTVDPREEKETRHFEVLDEFRQYLSWRRGDAVVLAEANVEGQEVAEFFGKGDRLPMLFNFDLNECQFLAMARQDAEPLRNALANMPELPTVAQWATFLRNHDEVDLSGLSDEERAEVFEAFGPDASMQLYGRGLRRRLAPMLGGDQRRIQMAYALQCTLPGTPVIRYGEEIGMGEDLSIPDRGAIRTPMQWSAERNGGFSTAEPDRLCRPVILDGPFGYERVNVADQRRDPESLLHWMEGMLSTLRECPEFGLGECLVLDSAAPSVLAVRRDAATGVVIAVTNLSDAPVTVDLTDANPDGCEVLEVFSDGPYDRPARDLSGLKLEGFGYRWIRLRSPG